MINFPPFFMIGVIFRTTDPLPILTDQYPPLHAALSTVSRRSLNIAKYISTSVI